MTAHNEHEAKDSSHAKIDVDAVAESGAAPAKGARARQALQKVGHYLMLIVVPLISVAALGMALMAIKSNGDNQAQLDGATQKIEELSSALSATKSELELIRMAALKDKTNNTEAQAKQDEIIKKIVQNITAIQTKLKISPTLEHQLVQADTTASPEPAHAAAASVTPAPAAATTAHASSPSPTPAPTHSAKKNTEPTHAAATPVTSKPTPPSKPTPASKPAVATKTKDGDTSVQAQVRAMKEAIEQYNKK